MARKTKGRQLAASADVPQVTNSDLLENGFQVEDRDIGAGRELVRISEGSPAWIGEWDARLDPLLRGAIVRIDPPLDAIPLTVEQLRVRCLEAGALSVRCSPIRKSAVLPDAKEAVPHKRARDVVVALVAKANVEDRPALAAFCEQVMAQQGL